MKNNNGINFDRNLFIFVFTGLFILFFQAGRINSQDIGTINDLDAVGGTAIASAGSSSASAAASNAGDASGAVPALGTSILGSPSAFANTHLSHTPWNFTSPNLLFHTSKTINDGSCFSHCRLVNIGANLKRSIKSKIFGIFDEREFVASGVPTSGIPIASGSVIACGVHSRLPIGCLQFLGTGYVLLEEHSSTEAALVSLARMAGGHGANLVGNVHCGFTETIRGTSATGGLGISTNEIQIDGDHIGLAAGLTMGRTVVERPSKPNCSADFFIAGANRSCYVSHAMGSNQTYMPRPVPQRRYLPPAVNSLPPPQMQIRPTSTAPVILPNSKVTERISSQSVVRGQW